MQRPMVYEWWGSMYSPERVSCHPWCPNIYTPKNSPCVVCLGTEWENISNFYILQVLGWCAPRSDRVELNISDHRREPEVELHPGWETFKTPAKRWPRVSLSHRLPPPRGCWLHLKYEITDHGIYVRSWKKYNPHTAYTSYPYLITKT